MLINFRTLSYLKIGLLKLVNVGWGTNLWGAGWGAGLDTNLGLSGLCTGLNCTAGRGREDWPLLNEKSGKSWRLKTLNWGRAEADIKAKRPKANTTFILHLKLWNNQGFEGYTAFYTEATKSNGPNIVVGSRPCSGAEDWGDDALNSGVLGEGMVLISKRGGRVVFCGTINCGFNFVHPF